MENSVKNPDRINITKRARELVTKIDDKKYFYLHDSIISRSELFTFAMAIGLDTVPTKLESIYSGGFVQDKSIDSRTRALMYALFINKLDDDNVDRISMKDAVYTMAQEYANTGFEIIEDYMERKKDTDLIWVLFDELDAQYKGLFQQH